MDDRAARRRRLLRRGLGVLVGLVLGLAAAEVAVRVRYPVLNLRRDFEPGIYVEDPVRGYANQADYRGVFRTYFEDTPVRTNSLGFRGEEPPADVEGALRVLCLGDSNVFGQGVRDDETLPAQLERLLAAKGRAVVYNAGVSGYATENELRTLQVFGPRLRPQVVVLGWLDNDLEGPDLQVGHGHLVERAEDKDGNILVSREKAEFKQNWDRIQTICNEGGTVQGKVKAVVKGGLVVNIGVEAFCPSSQIDISPPKNLQIYVGNAYEFKVVKLNPERQNVVLSRRELVEAERNSRRATLLQELVPGDVRKGVVKNITDFGAFIDLNGLDGLLHITDMSWGRISHPSELLRVGQELDVVILDINREKERVSLGLKQKEANPWDNIESKFPLGAKVKGKVVNLVPYGAFV
ncbi:MAG: S1 RNA-binding domain-containing protein, partial [Planctomycetota bacterium]|nr:S1 RNA-binding domain-containing protein [Planctomycetota bacterium]